MTLRSLPAIAIALVSLLSPALRGQNEPAPQTPPAVPQTPQAPDAPPAPAQEAAPAAPPAEQLKDHRLYELRKYAAAPDKIEALIARYRDHTDALLKKHGITTIGYWVPENNQLGVVYYLVYYPDKAAREEDWKEFNVDPEVLKVKEESEKDGPLVSGVEQIFLNATNFSPDFTTLKLPDGPHLFELRTYTVTENHLPNLHKRFQEHTMALFEKHGMTNLGYFQPIANDAKHETTLVYFLAHKDKAAAEASWKAFGEDPEWIAAKKASEDEAGGSLTAQDGVRSEFLKATDFSAIK